MQKTIRCILVSILAALTMSANASQTCRSEGQIPSSAPYARFSLQSGGTVIDKETGLIWSRCPYGTGGDYCVGIIQTLTWEEALNTADSQWRLPNIKELQSLVEVQCFDPAINNSMFLRIPSGSFWSSTPGGPISATSSAYILDFETGKVNVSTRTSEHYVLLIRVAP